MFKDFELSAKDSILNHISYYKFMYKKFGKKYLKALEIYLNEKANNEYINMLEENKATLDKVTGNVKKQEYKEEYNFCRLKN